MAAVGTFIKYADIPFSEARMVMVRQADQIMQRYEGKGMTMTLRQLYYQFVVHNLFANNDSNYDKLGGVVADGRMAGLLSWTAIEDRTRALRGLTFFDTPLDALRDARDNYRRDLWVNQYMRPEVWVEKDAILGVIAPICAELRVNYFSCRGYNSHSEQWNAGQRFARYYRKGQRPIVFHLGDHDPSGMDMTRDNQERLSTFAGTEVSLVRLALNFDQVEEYQPPPNPTKFSDSRSGKYIEKYGRSSWELDALDPLVLAETIRTAVMNVRDETAWDAMLKAEAADQDTLDLWIEEHS